MWHDISNFYETKDYLSMVSAILFMDMTLISMCYTETIPSICLRKWYKTYGICAMLADTLIIFLGMIVVRYLYTKILRWKTFHIGLFLLLALGVQWFHDILFALFVQYVPRQWNTMLDLFKDYIHEVGFYALLGDSCMILFSSLLASWYAGFSWNINIINFFFTLYFVPYVLFMR